MSKFSMVKIKDKTYKRRIVGIHVLSPEQKKKLKILPHLWRSGYCGSLVQGDTVLEVYEPLVGTKVKIAREKKEEQDSQDPYQNYELFQQIDDEEEY